MKSYTSFILIVIVFTACSGIDRIRAAAIYEDENLSSEIMDDEAEMRVHHNKRDQVELRYDEEQFDDVVDDEILDHDLIKDQEQVYEDNDQFSEVADDDDDQLVEEKDAAAVAKDIYNKRNEVELPDPLPEENGDIQPSEWKNDEESLSELIDHPFPEVAYDEESPEAEVDEKSPDVEDDEEFIPEFKHDDHPLLKKVNTKPSSKRTEDISPVRQRGPSRQKSSSNVNQLGRYRDRS